MEVTCVEQHYCIKIAVLRGRNAMECHSELVETHGNNAIRYRTVARFFHLLSTGALCYAELGTSIPVSGAEYSYYLRVYGSKGRFGPIPAFLYLWMCSLIIKTSAVAIMLLTFAEYIVEPMFPTCAAPGMIKKLVALIGICKCP
ncbi:UNVERIFIED_CONTAM: L-type amino acid transporter 1-like protein IMAA [Trichonephila clavipes]